MIDLPPVPAATGYVVAYSGGRDSMVLLHRLRAAGLPLRALHVHHGLQPAADAFAAHCARVAADWGVALTVLRVTVRDAGEGLEAAARAARYAALWAALRPGEVLVTAHHAQDQAETLLLRLLRGTGPEGLAGMVGLRDSPQGRLWRPLLAVTPAVLAAYAAAHRLEWVEDPHNADERHERVWLRREVLPRIAQRRPAWVEALGRLALLAAEANERLARLTEAQLAACRHPETRWGAALAIPALAALPAADRAAVLRAHWAAQTGAPPPSAAVLERVWTEVALARPDAEPQVITAGHRWCRHRDALYCLPPPPAPPGGGLWQQGRVFTLPGLGRWQADVAPDHPLRVAFPAGGERIVCAGERRHRRLKMLFQAAGVPPWERARTPLLFEDERLIAVAGLAVADGAPPGLRWQPASQPVHS